MNGSLRTFQSRLLKWYQAHHRALPWRVVGAGAHTQLDAYHVLVSEAEEWEADSVFVGSTGLSRLERFILGSVSAAVAPRVSCSVEVVRGA